MVEDSVETGGTLNTEKLSDKFAEVLLELCTTVGKRLKGIRLEKDMTQQEVRDVVGISDVYISGVERGKRNPTLERLCVLAYAYGYNVVVLIETDKDVKLITKSIEELRQHERDEGGYIKVLSSIRDEIDAVLGHRGKEE
jgi:transcriptional regulator with XRE-family HTH domain